jgi:hypothetical protein
MRQAIAAMGTATLFRAADSCVLVLGVLLVSVGGASPEIAWGESTILELREEYYQATEDSDIADTFYEKMEAIPETATPLQLGYKGLAALVQAKHSFNPINKMRYFSEGRELLDGAIVKDPTSVELHFLRYTVQDNAPFNPGSPVVGRIQWLTSNYLNMTTAEVLDRSAASWVVGLNVSKSTVSVPFPALSE